MPKAFELVLVAAGVIAAGSVDHALRGKHSTRNSSMLMYEALMHHLVRRHIAGAGFDPTTMARLSVLRDIYGMPVHTRTSRKTRPLMPSSPTCFLGLKDATWLTTGWTFWQWYGVSFILTEGRFI